MQQGNDQADREDDKASTGGMSNLDFNYLSDFENNADTLEAAEPADEGTSTLEPPSAFMEMKRNLRGAALRAIQKITNKDSSWNHRGEEE